MKKAVVFVVLATVLVFGMTVVGVEAQSNKGGEFTLVNIPARYDGKYAFLEVPDFDFSNAGLLLYGADSVDLKNETVKCSRIIDGKVILPLWFSRDDGKNLERYSGNHTVDVTISIVDSPTFDSGVIETVYFRDQRDTNSRDLKDKRVRFSNGSATKSFDDRSTR